MVVVPKSPPLLRHVCWHLMCDSAGLRCASLAATTSKMHFPSMCSNHAGPLQCHCQAVLREAFCWKCEGPACAQAHAASSAGAAACARDDRLHRQVIRRADWRMTGFWVVQSWMQMLQQQCLTLTADCTGRDYGRRVTFKLIQDKLAVVLHRARTMCYIMMRLMRPGGTCAAPWQLGATF
jgi:hypothetical protein